MALVASQPSRHVGRRAKYHENYKAGVSFSDVKKNEKIIFQLKIVHIACTTLKEGAISGLRQSLEEQNDVIQGRWAWGRRVARMMS